MKAQSRSTWSADPRLGPQLRAEGRLVLGVGEQCGVGERRRSAAAGRCTPGAARLSTAELLVRRRAPVPPARAAAARSSSLTSASRRPGPRASGERSASTGLGHVPPEDVWDVDRIHRFAPWREAGELGEDCIEAQCPEGLVDTLGQRLGHAGAFRSETGAPLWHAARTSSRREGP